MADADPPPPPPPKPEPPPKPQESFQKKFHRVKYVPLTVNGLTVDGLKRTRAHIIEREMKPVYEAATLEELKDRLLEASSNIQDLDIFKYVDILVDAAEEDKVVDLHMTVKERDMTQLHAGTFVQGGEGSVEATLKLRNYLGLADTYELNLAKGHHQSSTFALSGVLPRLQGTNAEAEVKVHKIQTGHTKHSSYTEDLQGSSVHLRSNNHEVSYELGMRHVLPTPKIASKAVEKFRGPQLKSALKYMYLLDKRDNPHNASNGYAVRATTEFCGVGLPSANILRYVRSELWGVAAMPLTDMIGLKFAASAGVVLPWGKDWESTATSIADRFFIGGAETLRGFRTRGVGPSDMRRQAPASSKPKEGEGSSSKDGEAGKKPKLQRDYLGGDLKLTGFAALTCKFPNRILSSLNMKGQVFVNAGTVTPLWPCGPGGLDTSSLSKRIADDMRVTTGVGILFPISVGLIELNYCHIHKFKDTDRVKRGLQFSITPGGGIA